MPAEEPPPPSGPTRTILQLTGDVSGEVELPISLSAVAAERALSVDDQIKKQTADLRDSLANKVVRAFLWANLLTLAAIAALVSLDEINIWRGLIDPADRVISGRVVIALLAATTVQVGAVAAVIARHLFPSRSNTDGTN